MKVKFSIFFVFAFLSWGSAQDTWLLDSISIFELRNNVAQNPFFSKISYNSDSKTTYIKSTLAETTFWYGTHHELSVSKGHLGFTSNQYRKWDDKNRTLYNSFEFVSADSSYTNFSENIYIYDGGQVDDYPIERQQFSRNLFMYEDKILKRRERYNQSGLQQYTDYTYDAEGRLLESIERGVDGDRFSMFTYTYAEDGRLKERVHTIEYYGYEQTETSTFKGSNGIDSVISIVDAGYFISGTLNVNFIEGDDRVSNIYRLEDSTLDNMVAVRQERYRFSSFPHGLERSRESYNFDDDLEMVLIRDEKIEIIAEQDDKYTTQSVLKNFEMNGATNAIKTVFSDYVRTKENENLKADIDFRIVPNPMSVGSYFSIELNQTAVSSGIIFDSQGRQVQELSLGTKENMHWRAPDMPGQYFLVFIAKDGSRSQPKAFQVY